MSFDVSPPALKTFASAMDTLSSASGEAVGYATYTSPEASGGSAIVRFLNSTADVQPKVEALFRHLRGLASASADEMVQVARDYEITDAASAAASDRTYRDVADAPDGTGGRGA